MEHVGEGQVLLSLSGTKVGQINVLTFMITVITRLVKSHVLQRHPTFQVVASLT